jgi:hypothetical protein
MQQICATERLQRGDWCTSTLIVLHAPTDYDCSIFKSLPGIGCWDDIIFISIEFPEVSGFTGKIRRTIVDCKIRRAIAQASDRIGNVDSVIVGHSISFWHRVFARSLPHNSCIFVDDGLLTLTLDFDDPDFFRESLADRVRRYSLGIRQCCELGKVEIFTAFPFASGRHKVVRNAFDMVRSHDIGARAVDRHIWFAGQPLVRAGLVTLDRYIGALRDIKERYYPNETMFYCPHPQERATGLDQIVADALGWDIRSSAVAIEIELLTNEILPRAVATFFSSVVMTLPVIFRGRLPVDVFVLNSDRDLIRGAPRERIIKLYDRLAAVRNANSGFRMLDL